MIRQRCTEITHITVHEVLDRSNYPQLGRIMFSGVDLGAFIEPDVNDGDDNDNEDGDGDGNDDEESETLGDLARMDNSVSYAVLAYAAVRWIKHMADQNMVGQREGKFKVNLWKGKGDKVIYSSRFLCTNTEYEEPAVAVPAPTVPLPGPNPDTSPDPRTWRAHQPRDPPKRERTGASRAHRGGRAGGRGVTGDDEPDHRQADRAPAPGALIEPPRGRRRSRRAPRR